MFAGLRRIGLHAHSFYTTVGIFLVAGAVVATIGTYAFAMLAEVVSEGYTQPYDEAIKYLREAVKLDPKHFESQYYLGVCLQRTGKISDAFGLIKPPPGTPPISIDELNEIIAKGWAGER